MHTPMELLSPVTTRTDSGKGAEASTPKSRQSSKKPSFEKAFEEELNRHDIKMLKKQTPDDSTKNDNSVDRAKQDAIVKSEDKIDDKDAELAVGVNYIPPQQQQKIVSILEGEESVDPAEQDLPVVIGAENKQPETILQKDIPDDKPAEPTENFAKQLEETVPGKAETPQNETNTLSAGTTEVKEVISAKTDKPADTAVQTEKESATGEVTARTPEVKSDNKSNGKSDDNRKDNGEPRPLENKNDYQNTKTTDRKDETYSKAVDAVKTKTDDKPADKPEQLQTQQPVLTDTASPPPLSSGIQPEQFKANEQMTQTVLTQAVKPENLFEEMISKVESNLTAAKSTMTIQLNPEYLGKVALEVAVDASGVHVKINAEDTNVRGMINSQIAMLIESLESKGIAVSEVEVVFAGANFDNFSGQGNDGQRESSSGSRKNKSGDRAGDSVEYYTTLTQLMDYYLDTGVSSVEYSA